MAFKQMGGGSAVGNITKKYTLDSSGEKKLKCPCKNCCVETNHTVIASYAENGSEYCGSGNSVDWRIDNQLIQCMGCEEVSFRTASSDSESYYDDYETDQRVYDESITYYPGRVLGSKIIDHWSLPVGIGQIYREARTAVESELFIVGGIAIRALLESICSDVKAKGCNLEKKIDDLHARSLVTKEGVETLHKIRVLGNRAAHKAQHHSRDQLLLALEVIEHILTGTYIIPDRSAAVFKSIVLPALAPPESPAESAEIND